MATEKEPTKAELVEQARDLDIEGRSSMDKDELAEAVADASARRPVVADVTPVTDADLESLGNASANAGLT